MRERGRPLKPECADRPSARRLDRIARSTRGLPTLKCSHIRLFCARALSHLAAVPCVAIFATEKAHNTPFSPSLSLSVPVPSDRGTPLRRFSMPSQVKLEKAALIEKEELSRKWVGILGSARAERLELEAKSAALRDRLSVTKERRACLQQEVDSSRAQLLPAAGCRRSVGGFACLPCAVVFLRGALYRWGGPSLKITS